MPENPTVEVPVVKPTRIEVSSDPRGDATIHFDKYLITALEHDIGTALSE